MDLIIGGSLEEDAEAFLDAWRCASEGEEVKDIAVAFESCAAFIAALTGDR
jgi:hypothetical protein